MSSVGIISSSIAKSYSLSGPIIRSTGYIYDIRHNFPYETFKFCSIPIIYGKTGDNFTRFFLRLEEIFISIQYLDYLLSQITISELFNKTINPITMEKVILDFKKFSEGYNISTNKSYIGIESPKGEFGVSLISSNKMLGRPFRLKVRAPGFYNLTSLNIVCTNYILSDLLSFLSTLDLILGEVDR